MRETTRLVGTRADLGVGRKTERQRDRKTERQIDRKEKDGETEMNNKY